jgi:phosphate transport system substrate-binding protein
MFFSRVLTTSIALSLCSSIVLAEPITLKSTTGSVELIGELKSYDNGVYVIETDLGELEVDARTVTCVGSECPKAESLTSEITLFGNKTLVNQLLIPLLESYSFALDANIETVIEADTRSTIKIISQSGQEFAKITVHAGNLSELEKTMAKAKNALVIGSGSSDILANSSSSTNITPLAADAIVAITSDTNPVKSISLNALQKVLSGAITNWKDLGGPDVDINVYLPQKQSDLTKIANIMGFDMNKSKSAERFDSLDDLSNAAASDPYGLGFTNFSNLRTAKALPIHGGCGAYVQPNIFNISAGSYPAAYYHFIKTEVENPPIFAREFLSYLGESQAKEMIDRQGYPSLSVFENGLESQGNRIVHGLLSTAKTVPITEMRSMLNTLNGARQLSTVLRFTPGTTDLDTQSATALEALVSEFFLGNYADQTLMVIGYTSSEGSTGENKRNSKASAQLISGYIKDSDSGGLLADLQIEVFGYGEASPLVCEDTPEGVAKNNRVEIWVKDNS